jgi:hypothetical protein
MPFDSSNFSTDIAFFNIQVISLAPMPLAIGLVIRIDYLGSDYSPNEHWCITKHEDLIVPKL